MTQRARDGAAPVVAGAAADSLAHGPLQAEAERERRGQQEVGVPERVFEQAVHGDQQHHHEGGALDGGAALGSRPSAIALAQRLPERVAASAPSTSAPAACPARPRTSGSRLWVWSKNATGRPGNGVSVQAKLNSPKPTPSHGMQAISDERVRPDAEAGAGDVALSEARLAAEHLMAVRAQTGAVHQMRRTPRASRTSRAGAARQALSKEAPAGQRQHAHRAGARGAQDDDEDEQRAPARRRSRRSSDLRLAEPDDGDDRPQQQAAEVVGLAQVADRAALDRGARDPVAVGEVGREHLDEADQHCWRRPRRPGRCRKRGRRESARPGALRRGSRPRCTRMAASDRCRGRESESDQGTPAKTDAPSAADERSAIIAASSASAPARSRPGDARQSRARARAEIRPSRRRPPPG